MALRIVAAEEGLMPAVRAFNERMAAAGSDWGFFDSAQPNWLAPDGDDPIWRRHFLVTDGASGAVHGGYVLKQQPFQLGRAIGAVGHVQGPVSEGIVNPRFAILGPLMLRDSLQKLPLQFVWGPSPRKAALLTQSGWRGRRVPLLLDLIRPDQVLQSAAVASGRRLATPVARTIGALGLGRLGMGAIRLGKLVAGGEAPGAAVRIEPGYGAWADPVWAAAAPHYPLAAVRTGAALARIMPPGRWPDVTICSVWEGARLIGHAAYRCQQVEGHRQLGTLPVALMIDALALPGLERAVARAVADHLRRTTAALAVGAFSDARWQRAFGAAGYVATPPRRLLMASPALLHRLAVEGDAFHGHFTLADGDGPRLF